LINKSEIVDFNINLKSGDDKGKNKEKFNHDKLLIN